MLFLLMCSKLVNFVKINEKDILSNKIKNLDLKSVIMKKDTDLEFEGKLNSFIANYYGSRKQFTTSKYQKNDFNYSEKDFEFKTTKSFRSDTVNFLNKENLNKKVSKTNSRKLSETLVNELTDRSNEFNNQRLHGSRGGSRTQAVQPVPREDSNVGNSNADNNHLDEPEPATSQGSTSGISRMGSWFETTNRNSNNNEF